MKLFRKATSGPSLSLKTIASFIVLSFVATQILIPTPTSFAMPAGRQAQNSNVPGGDPVSVSTAQVLNGMIAVPPGLGKIEESFQGASGKTILFIQDAHDSLEAQENIAKLIGNFVKEKGIKTVFEEGYEGPVPTEKFFGFIKDPEIKQKVSYFLLDKLRIGGAEYAHINREQDFELIGVENLDLYSKNIEAYRDSSRKRKDTEADLDELLKHILILANRYFPKELKSWLRFREGYSKGERPLLDYLKALRALYRKNVADPDSFFREYPALTILLAAETTRDQKLIGQLNALDSRVIFEEASRLEQGLSKTFLQNDRDKKIFDYYQGLSLLKRLNQIQLTQSEYEAAKDALEKLETQKLVDFIVSLTRRSLVLSKEWERHIKEAVRFYNVAQKRDGAIDQHIRAFQEGKEEAAILVFGGFHASAIKDMFRQQGFSYVVISPKITAIDKRHQDYYKRLMSDGLHPFEAPFLVTRANRAPGYPYLAATGNEEFVRAKLHAIASSVDAGNSDPQLIERRLVDLQQAMQPAHTVDRNAQLRSEMREAESTQEDRNTLELYEGLVEARELLSKMDFTAAARKLEPLVEALGKLVQKWSYSKVDKYLLANYFSAKLLLEKVAKKKVISDNVAQKQSVQILAVDPQGKILLQKRGPYKQLFASKYSVSANAKPSAGADVAAVEEKVKASIRQEIGIEADPKRILRVGGEDTHLHYMRSYVFPAFNQSEAESLKKAFEIHKVSAGAQGITLDFDEETKHSLTVYILKDSAELAADQDRLVLAIGSETHIPSLLTAVTYEKSTLLVYPLTEAEAKAVKTKVKSHEAQRRTAENSVNSLTSGVLKLIDSDAKKFLTIDAVADMFSTDHAKYAEDLTAVYFGSAEVLAMLRQAHAISCLLAGLPDRVVAVREMVAKARYEDAEGLLNVIEKDITILNNGNIVGEPDPHFLSTYFAISQLRHLINLHGRRQQAKGLRQSVQVMVFDTKGRVLVKKQGPYSDLFPSKFSVALGSEIAPDTNITNSAQQVLKDYLEIGSDASRLKRIGKPGEQSRYIQSYTFQALNTNEAGKLSSFYEKQKDLVSKELVLDYDPVKHALVIYVTKNDTALREALASLAQEAAQATSVPLLPPAEIFETGTLFTYFLNALEDQKVADKFREPRKLADREKMPMTEDELKNLNADAYGFRLWWDVFYKLREEGAALASDLSVPFSAESSAKENLQPSISDAIYETVSRQVVRNISVSEHLPLEIGQSLVHLDHPDSGNKSVSGGKGANLHYLRMLAAEEARDNVSDPVRVPEGYILRAEVFKKVVLRNPFLGALIERLRILSLKLIVLRDRKAKEAKAMENELSAWRKLIAGARFWFLDLFLQGEIQIEAWMIRTGIRWLVRLPKPLLEDISKMMGSLQGDATEVSVAVRSSASVEDSSKAACAGKADSVLARNNTKQVSRAVIQVWASLFNSGFVNYRILNQMTETPMMPVVILKMVDAKSAGNVFSVDTTTGRPAFRINAKPGLGEGVVSGSGLADEWTISPDAQTILEEQPQPKTEKIITGEHGTVRVKITDPHEQMMPSLEMEAVMRLAKISQRIRSKYNSMKDVANVDIEFAQDKSGVIHVVQTRPETTISKAGFIEIKTVDESDMDSTVKKMTLPGDAVVGFPSVAIGVLRVRPVRMDLPENQKRAESQRIARKIKAGDILVTQETDNSWDNAFFRMAGVITENGNTTSHAAVTARERDKACVVGSKNAVEDLKKFDDQSVVLDSGTRTIYYRDDGMPPAVKVKTVRIELKMWKQAAELLAKPAPKPRDVWLSDGDFEGFYREGGKENYMPDFEGEWRGRPKTEFGYFELDYYYRAFEKYAEMLNNLFKTNEFKTMPRKFKDRIIYSLLINEPSGLQNPLYRRELVDYDSVLKKRVERFMEADAFFSGLPDSGLLSGGQMQQATAWLVELLAWMHIARPFHATFQDKFWYPQARFFNAFELSMSRAGLERAALQLTPETEQHWMKKLTHWDKVKEVAAIEEMIREDAAVMKLFEEGALGAIETRVRDARARRTGDVYQALADYMHNYKASDEDIRKGDDEVSFLHEFQANLASDSDLAETIAAPQLLRLIERLCDKNGEPVDVWKLKSEKTIREKIRILDLKLFLALRLFTRIRMSNAGEKPSVSMEALDDEISQTIQYLRGEKAKEEKNQEKFMTILGSYPTLRKIVSLNVQQFSFMEDAHQLITRYQKKMHPLMIETAKAHPEVFGNNPELIFDLSTEEVVALSHDADHEYLKRTFERRGEEEKIDRKVEAAWRDDREHALRDYEIDMEGVKNILRSQKEAARHHKVREYYDAEIERIDERVRRLKAKVAAEKENPENTTARSEMREAAKPQAVLLARQHKSIPEGAVPFREGTFASLIDFLPSLRCQLKCRQCWARNFYSQKEIAKYGTKEPSFKEILHTINLLAETGIEGISFSGGEPTIVPRFDEIIAYVKSKGMKVFVNTNGLQFKKVGGEIFIELYKEDRKSTHLVPLEKFISYVDQFCFSLDTVDPHSFRGEIPLLWPEVIASIKTIAAQRDKDIEIVITTTVTRENIDKVKTDLLPYVEGIILDVFNKTKQHYPSIRPPIWKCNIFQPLKSFPNELKKSLGITYDEFALLHDEAVQLMRERVRAYLAREDSSFTADQVLRMNKTLQEEKTYKYLMILPNGVLVTTVDDGATSYGLHERGFEVAGYLDETDPWVYRKISEAIADGIDEKFSKLGAEFAPVVKVIKGSDKGDPAPGALEKKISSFDLDSFDHLVVLQNKDEFPALLGQEIAKRVDLRFEKAQRQGDRWEIYFIGPSGKSSILTIRLNEDQHEVVYRSDNIEFYSRSLMRDVLEMLANRNVRLADHGYYERMSLFELRKNLAAARRSERPTVEFDRELNVAKDFLGIKEDSKVYLIETDKITFGIARVRENGVSKIYMETSFLKRLKRSKDKASLTRAFIHALYRGSADEKVYQEFEYARSIYRPEKLKALIGGDFVGLNQAISDMIRQPRSSFQRAQAELIARRLKLQIWNMAVLRLNGETRHVRVRINDRSPVLTSSDEDSGDAKMLYYSIAANPLHFGHIEAMFRAMVQSKADIGVIRVQGADDRKGAIGRTIEERHDIVAEFIALMTGYVKDIFEYSDIGKGTSTDGESDFIDLIKLNVGRKNGRFYAFNLGGSDHRHYFAPDYELWERTHQYRAKIKDGKPEPDTLLKFSELLRKHKAFLETNNVFINVLFSEREPHDSELLPEEVNAAESSRKENLFQETLLRGMNYEGASAMAIRDALSGIRNGDILMILPELVQDSIMGKLPENRKIIRGNPRFDSDRYRGFIIGLPVLIKQLSINSPDKDLFIFNQWLEVTKQNRGREITSREIVDMFNGKEMPLLLEEVDAAFKIIKAKTATDNPPGDGAAMKGAEPDRAAADTPDVAGQEPAVKPRSEMRDLATSLEPHRELTPEQKAFLTPEYGSVLDFWHSGWREAHPDAVVVYAIRHQESISNLTKVTQTRYGFSPGTFRGKKQAQALDKFLAKIPFDIFVSSDSERAYQTLYPLWKRRGRQGVMPVDSRLAETSIFPVAGVPGKMAKVIFDPENFFERYPEAVTTLQLDSLAGMMGDLREFSQDLLNSPSIKGKTVAIGAHGGSILALLMAFGQISVKKYTAVRGFADFSQNVGINVVAYLPEKKQWKLLVAKDDSYLPKNLKRQARGVEALIYRLYALVQVLVRRVQFLLSGKKVHPLHRDYYPEDKTWYRSLWTPTEHDVIKWRDEFLAQYPDREAEQLRNIPAASAARETRSKARALRTSPGQHESAIESVAIGFNGSPKRVPSNRSPNRVPRERSETRMETIPGVSTGPSDQIIQNVRRNTQPVTVFLDAEDWGSLSEAQKQEYLFVALSRSETRIIVYNENGQVHDEELAALLKLERVTRTERNLDQAVNVFSRFHVPTVHLSKQVLPSRTSIGSLRKRVSFFKMNSDKSGSLAMALLWAISGGEDIRMPEVRQEGGFWTVEESLLDALQRTYDNNFIVAIAA